MLKLLFSSLCWGGINTWLDLTSTGREARVSTSRAAPVSPVSARRRGAAACCGLLRPAAAAAARLRGCGGCGGGRGRRTSRFWARERPRRAASARAREKHTGGRDVIAPLGPGGGLGLDDLQHRVCLPRPCRQVGTGPGAPRGKPARDGARRRSARRTCRRPLPPARARSSPVLASRRVYRRCQLARFTGPGSRWAGTAPRSL